MNQEPQTKEVLLELCLPGAPWALRNPASLSTGSGLSRLLCCCHCRGGCKKASRLLQLWPITRAFKASKQVILLSALPISLCLLYFSEGLNAEYVKGENMEAVVSEEPQGESLVPLTPACIPPQKQLYPGTSLKSQVLHGAAVSL